MTNLATIPPPSVRWLILAACAAALAFNGCSTSKDGGGI
jgi:hypothetical protein